MMMDTGALPPGKLATFELKHRRQELVGALERMSPDDPAHADLQEQLQAVIKEQDERAQAAQGRGEPLVGVERPGMSYPRATRRLKDASPDELAAIRDAARVLLEHQQRISPRVLTDVCLLQEEASAALRDRIRTVQDEAILGRGDGGSFQSRMS